jgi:hypothetical protein
MDPTGGTVGGRQRHLVDGFGCRVLHRLQVPQIRNNRFGIPVRQAAIHAIGHGRANQRSVGAFAVADGDHKLGIGPVSDTGFLVGRQVRRDRIDRAFLHWKSAGKFVLRHWPALCCVAIAAGDDAFHKIVEGI